MESGTTFGRMLEFLKKRRVIASYKEFGDAIGQSKESINQLKSGYKKLKIEDLRIIKEAYPQINIGSLIWDTNDWQRYINLH